METVMVDTVLEVRGVACGGGDSVLIREKGSAATEPDAPGRSAWYLVDTTHHHTLCCHDILNITTTIYYNYN